ncbi:MAG TPA: hypothetical protein VFB99_20175 [Vicinamibacterales bacterium]|nr:hypothetical protein [Vicinamibacterales bacterium]
MTTPKDEPRAQYETLGIRPDVWTCVATAMDEADAKDYVFALTVENIPAKVARDTDGKRFHVAIQGGLIDHPAALFITFRGGPISEMATCTSTRNGQHPLVTA